MASPEPPSASERQSSEASTSDTVPLTKQLIDFEKTYAAVKHKRLSVEKVMIIGLDRTKEYIVSREMEPFEDARSLDEIKDAALEVQESLMSLDVFDGVEVIITDSETVNTALSLYCAYIQYHRNWRLTDSHACISMSSLKVCC